MSNRKTAYIAEISKIEDIPGKDRIKYASLVDLGFQVIVDNKVKLGDKVVYVEVDTIIPERCQWAEFLRSRCYSSKYKGFRIRAMKMADLYSEGIVFNIDNIFSGDKLTQIKSAEIGFDLSEELGIKSIDDDCFIVESMNVQLTPTKFQRFVKRYAYFIWKMFYYRKPENKSFPSFAANKSDETRVQNLSYLFTPENIERWKELSFYTSTKCDGKSMTCAISKGKFIIASRNFTKYSKPFKFALKDLTTARKDKFNDNFIYAAAKYNIPKKLNEYMNSLPTIMTRDIKEISITGELCGPGIQKNRLNLSDYEVFIFNICLPEYEKRYLDVKFLYHLEKFLPIVPDIKQTDWHWNNVKELLEEAKGNYTSGQPREGIVIRAFKKTGPFSDFIPDPEKGMSNMWSFKVINPDFALQKDES